jgi:hypothetical protein
MKDPRIIRQTMQAIAAYLVAAAPIALATPFDWRALVGALIAVTVALLTNPRLVFGVEGAMPAAGSSAVLPVTTMVQNPAAPQPSSEPTPVTIPIRPPSSKGTP